MSITEQALAELATRLRARLEQVMSVKEPPAPSDLTPEQQVIWRRGMRDGMRQVREAGKEVWK